MKLYHLQENKWDWKSYIMLRETSQAQNVKCFPSSMESIPQMMLMKMIIKIIIMNGRGIIVRNGPYK
jgi:hypothetical protein